MCADNIRKTLSNMRYFFCFATIAAAFLFGLAMMGTYFLTNLILESTQLAEIHISWRILISIFFPFIIGFPTGVLTFGYLKGELKIYPLIISLSKSFHSNISITWKMLLKIVILRLLGKSRFTFNATLENYVNACIGSSLLSFDKWTSTYVGSLEKWEALEHVLSAYIKKIHELRLDQKIKFIISTKQEIQNNLNQGYNKIFTDSIINANATTYVVYQDAICKNREFLDFSMFGDLVVIHAEPREFNKVLKKLQEKRDIKHWGSEKFNNEVSRAKIPVIISIKTEDQTAQSAFNTFLDEIEYLNNLNSNVKQEVKWDNQRKQFYLC